MLKIKLLSSDDNRMGKDPGRDHFEKNGHRQRVNVSPEDLALDDRPPGMSPRSAHQAVDAEATRALWCDTLLTFHD